MAEDNNPDYWRRHADEARAMAANLTGEYTRQTMLRIAESYDRLAAQAERLNKKP